MRVASETCALPLAHVVETLRPLPVRTLSEAPPFVLGISIIRGEPMPVVDLGAMLAPEGVRTVTRFVTLRVGERGVALAVSAVVGVRDLSDARVGDLPPLLRDCALGVRTAVGTLDRELLFILQAGRILPQGLSQPERFG